MDEMIQPGLPAGDTQSWIFSILFGVFLLVCFRMRGNLKFAATFFTDLVRVRERANMLDATMRETSLIFLMLLLSGCSAGVLLRCGAELFADHWHLATVLPEIPAAEALASPLASTAICMGLGCAYIALMWTAYNLVGSVFAERAQTWEWVRGFTSGTALAGILFFPLSLLCLIYPEWQAATVFASLMVLILVKILFIIKGFRIFFTESSSWVVFLYYLCSLEIIPLLITFGLACKLPG